MSDQEVRDLRTGAVATAQTLGFLVQTLVLKGVLDTMEAVQILSFQKNIVNDKEVRRALEEAILGIPRKS